MPSVAMSRPVLNRDYANAILDCIRPASSELAPIVAAKVALIGASAISINPDTTKAELDAVEAVFTGYTTGGSALTFAASNLRMLQTAVALAGNVNWVVGTATPVVTDTITGWYLYDTTYGLICAELLGSTVPLGFTGDWFDLFAGIPLYFGN